MEKEVYIPKLHHTLILFFVLVIPFLIRSFAPSLEPYPAVLLPLGIGLFDMDSTTIEVKFTELFVKNENDNWVEISPQKLLSPMPRYYLYPIYENDFGLVSTDSEEIRTAFGRNITIPKKKISDENIRTSKQWYKEKLIKLGYQSDSLRVLERVEIIYLQSGNSLRGYIENEKYYSFN